MLDTEFRIKPFAWLKCAWGFPLLVSAGFLAWLGLFCLPWSTYEIDWPSWVQAVGSIFAIGVSVWLTNRIHANERYENQRTQALEVVRGIYKAEVLLNEAAVAISVLKKQLMACRGTAIRLDLTRLDNANALLADVAVSQPLTDRAMRAVARAIEAVETVRSRLDKGREAMYSDDEIHVQPYLATVSNSRVEVELEYIAVATANGFGSTKRC